jgi:hypothetical protein
VTFDYRVARATTSSRAVVDIAIAAQSSETEAAIWVAPAGLVGDPDPGAIADASARWTVQPLDRVTAGTTRRVFLILRPAGSCAVGAPLWAELSLDGSWLEGDRGVRRLGGILTTCREPLLIREVLAVDFRSQGG